jgi:hypothetical protein
MRFTEDQASHLAHKTLEAIQGAGIKVANDRLARNEIKKTLTKHLDTEAGLHVKVAQKINSLGRNGPEGSAEYEVLYRQYYEEEMQRTRR